MFQALPSWEELANAGGNCYIIGTNKTYSIAPEKQFIALEFDTPNKDDSLILNVLDPNEIKKDTQFIAITQLNICNYLDKGINLAQNKSNQ